VNITGISLSIFEPFSESVRLPTALIGGIGISGQVPVNYAFRKPPGSLDCPEKAQPKTIEGPGSWETSI